MGEINEISLRERIRLNLVSAMENANINQVQLAEKLGISKGTVNNWARGNNSPDVDMVPRICKVLGISIMQLYSPTTPEAKEDESDEMGSFVIRQNEQEHIKKYRSLDNYGKEAVDGVLDVESRRCEANRLARADVLRDGRDRMEAAEEIAPEVYFIVPAFTSAMSAGTGQPAGDDYPENYRLTKEPPRGTSYIAPVSGISMKPTYQDGDKLFIHACTEIRPGQVGVFFMDGQQWVKELGDGVLLSHNPEYEPRRMTEDIVCQGLVLGVCDDSYFE